VAAGPPFVSPAVAASRVRSSAPAEKVLPSVSRALPLMSWLLVAATSLAASAAESGSSGVLPPSTFSAGSVAATTAAAPSAGPAAAAALVSPATPATPDAATLPATRGAAAENLNLKPKGKVRLLGKEVAPGTRKRLTWVSGMALEGLMAPVPLIVINGKGPGPTLCLTAAVHGDELNGIEIIHRVLGDIDPQEFQGAVIGVPIVNLQGFYRGTRYLPDRRDLNRYFPGNPRGNAAMRLAYSFFNEIISHCSALIDIHTGSLDRTNLPQVRADLHRTPASRLSRAFGATVVLHSLGERGSLRRAASEAGIPSVTLEMGEPMRVQPEQVEHGVKALETLLYSLGMTQQRRYWGENEAVYYSSKWVRVDHGGILFSDVALGEHVSEGELLGTVTDPLSDEQHRVYAPLAGRVLGMALNQVVLPGFAAYRIGIEGGGAGFNAGTEEREGEEAPSEDDSRPD
jgi:predicted deacylase